MDADEKEPGDIEGGFAAHDLMQSADDDNGENEETFEPEDDKFGIERQSSNRPRGPRPSLPPSPRYVPASPSPLRQAWTAPSSSLSSENSPSRGSLSAVSQHRWNEISLDSLNSGNFESSFTDATDREALDEADKWLQDQALGGVEDSPISGLHDGSRRNNL
jgi:hypothetical protein